MEMKQKRPRIPQRSTSVDRQENNVFENVTTENKATIEDMGWLKVKLPDIEMDEVWQKDTSLPSKMTDFPVDKEIDALETSNDSHEISDTIDLKDIYNSIRLDDSL